MSTEADLVAHLNSVGDLTALVVDRIYPARLPDDAVLPALTYQRISTVPEVGLGEVAIRQARFQFDCWADRYLDTISVAVQLRAALDLASPPGPSINRILPDGEGDHYEEATLLYRRSLDYLIFET